MMMFSHPRTGRWLARAVVLTAIGLSLYFEFGAFIVIPLLFVLVVPFEKMFPRHRGQRLRRPNLSLDLSWALAAPAMNVIGGGVALVVGLISLAWLPGLAIRPLVGMLPAAVLPFVGLALFDMAVYWVHRWLHEVPALWKFHSIHHSTEQLDWISGFRNHPFDGAIVAPPIFFLFAAGFPIVFTGVLALVQVALGLFLHANVRWRLRPLHRLVVTPEFHHWHHANEVEAHNSNYSAFLPLWDMLFGTYYVPRNKRPMRYGVSDDMPMTMVGQIAFPFRGVRSPRQMLRHPWRSLGDGRRTVGRVVRGVWRSTTRPRRLRPRPGEPCTWALEPPAVERVP